MTAIIEYIKRLFARVAPATTDEHCPHCYGLGFDYSGLTCICVRDKK
jgi:hypothetical protein